MKTELALFGKRLDVTSRTRRRRLVVVTYTILAVLLTACWMIDRSGVDGILAALLLGHLVEAVFGGNRIDENPFLGTHCVVTPFEGNEYIRWSKKTRPSLVRFLYPKALDERDIRNDERDVRTRDAAHYRAFGIMGGLVYLVAGIKVFNAPDRFISALLSVGIIFIYTLPQAIMLWSEPDMETESEAVI